ncbi:MAG: RDD family protein [Sphingobacteriales bacterium]
MYPVSIWLRLINLIVDLLFIRLVLLRLVVYPVVRQAIPSMATFSHESILLLSYLINAVVVFIYYFASESTTGVTVGKLLTQTKVVTQDGNKPTTRTVLFRTLWRLVPFEPFSWVTYAGWHDRKTNTMVVSRRYEQTEEESGEDI